MADKSYQDFQEWHQVEWSAECLEAEQKMGMKYARLLPLVGDVKLPTDPVYGTPLPRNNRVITTRGRGLLLQALDGNCMVLLDREAGRAAGARSKAEAKAPVGKNGKKKLPKFKFGVELPAAQRLHHFDIIPER